MAELFQIQDKYRTDREEKKRMKQRILIVALILLAGIGAVITVSYYYNNRCFTECRVENRVERNDSSNITYRYFQGNLLKFSRNGISAVDSTGKSLWNGGYEMNQPQVDVCGDFVSVADITGKQICVYNGGDEGVSIETALPLVRAKIAANGVVAALVQDSDSNVLNLYDPYRSSDTLLVEIPTNVAEEGYPLDFDVSPDGSSVVASYMSVSGADVENKVSFFNFSAVGQDKNTLVGGRSFGEKMVSCIDFLSDDRVAVFYEDGFSVFSHMKQPELSFEKTFEENIRSIAYDEENIAVVTEDEEENYNLKLFSVGGKEILDRRIDFEYSQMALYEDEIVFTGNHQCRIIRLNGRDKLNCTFEETAEGIFPTENGSVYIRITPDTIEKVKLGMKR